MDQITLGMAMMVATLACVSSAPAQEAPLALTGGTLLDPAQGRYVQGRSLMIADGRIEAIIPTGEEGVGVRTLDVSGLTILPGLIDLHSHLLLHPYNEAPWDEQVLKEALELRTLRGAVAARRTLEAGFTTLRELGTEGAGYADVALRDAINMGLIPGPRIFAASRAIVATGCYGPSGFDPRWDLPVGAQVADGPVGVRVAVREQIAAGADWIKVYADYRRKPGDRSTPTFSQEELNAIVDEATTAGVPVAAHASTDEAIRRAVRAGVRTIEHGYEASDEVLALMREQGVALCPTLMASYAMATYGGWEATQDDHPRVTTAKALMQRAIAARVIIACGSDVGVFAHGDNARELELMVDYGMSELEAIRGATSVAAKVLRRPSDLGRVAPGGLADLIAVEGDPLNEIAVLRNPVIVIKNGVVIVDRRN